MIAGVTVGIMAVPEAISYANLAGLPSEFGMTATLVPCVVYALFGSSRQLVGCSSDPPHHDTAKHVKMGVWLVKLGCGLVGLRRVKLATVQ